MITISNCPVCKSSSFTKSLDCKDYTVSQETFNLVTCDACKFLFTNPRPNDSVLGNYYKSESYISHSNTKKGIVATLYHLVRNYTLKKKLRIVESYVSRGTILDYGCGTGMFINEAVKAGWQTLGLEPDAGAREMANQLGMTVLADKAELLHAAPSIMFDAVTLWHVLEHVTDLEDTLRFFDTKLNKNGVLIIAVPNHNSFDAQHYNRFWAAYDVPRHLYHFDIDSVSGLLDRFGFALVESLPMKFDSFYVSMLSEKYKTGSVRYLNAFLTGLRSNNKARSTKEYSSRIYVFKKK